MDKNSFEDWNEEMSEKWDFDDYYNTQNIIIRHLEKMRALLILKFLNPQSHERILEVGCGAGHILEKIDKGILHGIELSKNLIALAEKRLAGKAEFKRCNAEALEYPDNFFDKIICADIIEHVQDPRRVLEEIRRVNKKGGLVIISITNDKIVYLLKNILVRLGLFKLFFKNTSKKKWNWHLHVSGLPFLNRTTDGILEKIEIKALPSNVLPLRYIGKYRVIK